MFELFYLLLIMTVFGAIASIHAGIMIIYEKIIRKSKKSIWQIISEI